MKNMTLALCKLYTPLSLSGRNTYDFNFLKSVTENIDLMSNDVFDSVFNIVRYQVGKVKETKAQVGDNSDIE